MSFVSELSQETIIVSRPTGRWDGEGVSPFPSCTSPPCSSSKRFLHIVRDKRWGGEGEGTLDRHCNYFSLTLWADFCFNNENLAEFYEDEPTLEQYSPLLGENFITYPMLEEYGVPTVEEFPEEDPDDDDEDDEKEEDSMETEHKDKKNGVTYAGGSVCFVV